MKEARKMKNKLNLLWIVPTILVFVIIVVACISAALSNKEMRETYALQPYEFPASRVDTLDSDFVNDVSDATVLPEIEFEMRLSALPTPVAVVMYESKADGHTVSFGITDRFETTNDLQQAKSILYVRINSNTVEELEEGIYSEQLYYYCSILSQDGAYKKSIYLSNGEALCYVSEPTAVEEWQLLRASQSDDEAFFAYLAENLTFAPDAADPYLETFYYACEPPYAAYREILTDCARSYEYPESENLSEHPELLDGRTPIICFMQNSELLPGNSAKSNDNERDPAFYIRDDALFDDMSSVVEIVYDDTDPEEWVRVACGEEAPILVFCERTGVLFMGNYGNQYSVYGFTVRWTFVDAGTQKVIGWSEYIPEFSNRGGTIRETDLIHIDSFYYYDDPLYLPDERLSWFSTMYEGCQRYQISIEN